MACYVVNLPAANARRQAMASQLEALGVPFRLFRAIDGHQLTEYQRSLHLDEARARREAGPLSPPQAGRALSHLSIYRDMVNRHVPHAIVLEDNLRLDTGFARLASLHAPDGLPARFTATDAVVVHLAGATDATDTMDTMGAADTPEAPAAWQVPRLRTGPRAAMAYFVTLAAARWLAEALYPVWSPADDWPRLAANGPLAQHALVPACAWPHDARSGTAAPPVPDLLPPLPAMLCPGATS